MPRGVALATVLAVLFLTFLDTTIVSVALGNIQFDLGAGVIPLQWVVNAYSLVFASLMLMAGSLSDRWGRKWMMVGGIAVFCSGSVLCALAPNVATVIGGRAVMGVGAAASEPGTLSVIRHLYPDRRHRARALGAWAAVSGLSLAMGPVIGGLLVGAAGWRAVFWFNLALGTLLLVAATLYVPNSSDRQPGRPDVWGFALGVVMLGSLIFAGISGEQFGYGAPWIVALFVVSGIALLGLVRVERRVRNPMIDARYLKSPAVSGALFVAFAVYFGVFSIFFFTALYLDLVIGYSGWQMAGVFAPMAAAIVIGSLVSGRWVAQFGTRTPMIMGCVVSAIGIFGSRQYLTAHPSFAALALVLGLAGLGFGVAVVPLTAAVLGYVPAQHSGMAASATNTARQLGAVIGVAALGGLVTSHLTSDFGSSLTHSGITGSGKDFIIKMLETGGSDAAGINIAHPSPFIKPLVDAATAAFRQGLHAALFVSAAMILVAATVIALVPRSALAPDSEYD
ncbi:MAG TPA: MFS transporter [Jatrophihabitantaceae bacterium]|nr:MFS transporter [Jatrophihabitantaceae bacterium]